MFRGAGVLLPVAFFLLAESYGRAQAGLGVSVAGQDAAEARRLANAMPQYYNLKWGDLQLRLQSSLGIEGNDNVNLSQSNREADVMFNPQLAIRASYPLSQQNTLNLDINGGYSFFVQHPNLDQFFVKPGTALSFDIYVKNVLLNIHNSLTVINQGYNNPTVSGVGDYSYLENASGLSATWDLNMVELSAGYDHLLRQSLTSINTENGNQDLFFASAGVRVNSDSKIGVEGTAGIIGYDQNELNGGVQYSAGLFYNAKLTENISTKLSVGYFLYGINSTGITITNNFQSSVDAAYGSVSLTHRVNARLNYSLEGGRQIQTGMFSDTLDLYYVRLQANSDVVRKFPITASFSYENGTETGGEAEKMVRFGYGAGVAHLLTRKLSSSLSYLGYIRDSNLPQGRYVQNLVSLTLTYSF